MLPPVAILAGGIATRLRPVTEKIPKALVEINGEPFLGHQLRLLRERGIGRVVLCVAYRGEMIRAFAGDGRAFGLEAEYSFDGPALRGTAGAIGRRCRCWAASFSCSTAIRTCRAITPPSPRPSGALENRL